MSKLSALGLGAYMALCMSTSPAGADDIDPRCSSAGGQVCVSAEISRPGSDADLTALKLENILPGWNELPGKSSHAVFNVVQKQQSTRFEDIVIDSGGVLIKGALEFDQKGDLVHAEFPTYSPSRGDQTALKAERSPDGVLKLTMRGDVFDGRGLLRSGLLRSVISGQPTGVPGGPNNFDLDLDLKLGAVAGYDGETVRNLEVKLSRRNGTLRSFVFSGKLGRDMPLIGGLHGRPRGRDVVVLATDDAGALLRFTGNYAKMSGGKLELAMEPPTVEPWATEGLIRIRDFSIKSEAALDRAAAGLPAESQSGTAFARLRAQFSWQNGQLAIREGVARGPTIGATIQGSVDYPGNQVRISGTLISLHGFNIMFGQVPAVGPLPGGGKEALIGATYEVVGPPAQPVLRVNPASAVAPGVFRKIFQFDIAGQDNPVEIP